MLRLPKIKQILRMLALSALTFVVSVAQAQTPSSISSPGASDVGSTQNATDDWTFRFSPYAWAAALSGTIGIKGVSTHAYLSIDDVLEHTDMGLMGNFEARHDRWSVITDFIWADLSDSGATPLEQIFTRAKVDVSEIFWTQWVGYTVIKDDCGVNLDLLAGFRFVSMSTDLKLTGGSLPSGDPVATRYLSLDKTWVDPVLGAHARMPLGEDSFFLLNGDIGGFNSSSAFTWQAGAAFGYDITKSAALGLGYRALNYEHDRDGFKYNATAYGPFLGAEFRF